MCGRGLRKKTRWYAPYQRAQWRGSSLVAWAERGAKDPLCQEQAAIGNRRLLPQQMKKI